MLRGYQRERAMIAGGAPIDCDHPLTPHITAKAMKSVILPTMPPPLAKPSAPTSRLATAETHSPAAMKRLMLLWSERNPLTNLPMA